MFPGWLGKSVSSCVLVDDSGDVMDGNPCRDVSMTSYRGAWDFTVLHIIDYVLSPATMVTHLVMMCLIYAMAVDGGLRRRQLTLLLLGEELLIYVLWLAVDHGLRAPFAIWVCITVYETIVKPQIRYQDRAVLFTGQYNYRNTPLVLCQVHTADMDKTELSCLVGGVNRIGDKSRLSATENF